MERIGSMWWDRLRHPEGSQLDTRAVLPTGKSRGPNNCTKINITHFSNYGFNMIYKRFIGIEIDISQTHESFFSHRFENISNNLGRYTWLKNYFRLFKLLSFYFLKKDKNVIIDDLTSLKEDIIAINWTRTAQYT